MQVRLRVPLSIFFDDINGVAQIKTANQRIEAAKPYDVMITAVAPLLSSDARCGGPSMRDLYEFLLPVHREDQHLVRSKLKDGDKFPGLKGIDEVGYLDASSCEEQYIGIKKDIGAGLKGVSWGISDLPSLLNGLEGNRAAILYDPPASRLIRAGLVVPIAGFDYRLWISMFAFSETLRKRGQIRNALVEAFVASWVYCRAHTPHAWGLLMSDKRIMTAFRRALLVGPLRM
jgi:hypothetical protein